MLFKKKCSFTSKYICTNLTKSFCKWGSVRNGQCRRKFCCQSSNGKVKCHYKGKTICFKLKRKIISHSFKKKIF